jgi:hypothetical protein
MISDSCQIQGGQNILYRLAYAEGATAKTNFFIITLKYYLRITVSKLTHIRDLQPLAKKTYIVRFEAYN